MINNAYLTNNADYSQRQAGKCSGPGPAAPQVCRTIYDVAPEVAATLQQVLPPEAYDIQINGHCYTVVTLQGLQESDYIRRLRDRLVYEGRESETLQMLLNCGGSAGELTSQRMRDAVFMALAYGLTRVTALSVSELLCFSDICETYGLPFDPDEVLRVSVGKVRTADDLFVIVNAAAAFKTAPGPASCPAGQRQPALLTAQGKLLDPLAAPGLTEKIAAAADAAWAVNCDTAEAFEAIIYALAFSWVLPGETQDEQARRKRDMIRSFGVALARRRHLPEAITSALVLGVSEGVLNAAVVASANTASVLDLGQVDAVFASTDRWARVQQSFKKNVASLLRDMRDDMARHVRSRLSRCMANWLVKMRTPISIDLEFDRGIVVSYPFLEYNLLSSQFFYNVATGQTDYTTGLPVYYSQTVPEFEKLLAQPNRLVVKIDPSILAHYGLDVNSNPSLCSDPDTLDALSYPFAKLGPVLPSYEVNQFGYCVVSTDVAHAVSRLIESPSAGMDVIDSLVC